MTLAPGETSWRVTWVGRQSPPPPPRTKTAAQKFLPCNKNILKQWNIVSVITHIRSAVQKIVPHLR
jgi:hypothetical protein